MNRPRRRAAWALVAAASLAPMISVPAINAAPSDAAANEGGGFVELARFDYGEATISGLGTKQWTSGATIATLPPDDRGLSRCVLSLALDRTGDDIDALGVVLLDAGGTPLPGVRAQAASGSGTRRRVATFVCEFEQVHGDIKTIVIQRRADGR